MADQGEHITALADAFTDHQAMEEAAAYLRGGRSYAALSDTELADRWVADLRAWLPMRIDEAAYTRFSNADSEMHLRGIARPFDVVRVEMDAARACATDEDRTALREKLRAFLISINDPAN